MVAAGLGRAKVSPGGVRQIRDSLQRVTDADFESAVEALETLPISSGDYAVASAKLFNAWLAVGRGDPGAAKYELMLLGNWLYIRGGEFREESGQVTPSKVPEDPLVEKQAMPSKPV